MVILPEERERIQRLSAKRPQPPLPEQLHLVFYQMVVGNTRRLVGAGAQSTSTKSVAPGYLAKGTGEDSIAIGDKAEATKNGALAFGHTAKGTGTYSTAIGEQAVSSSTGAVALGFLSKRGIGEYGDSQWCRCQY